MIPTLLVSAVLSVPLDRLESVSPYRGVAVIQIAPHSLRPGRIISVPFSGYKLAPLLPPTRVQLDPES